MLLLFSSQGEASVVTAVGNCTEIKKIFDAPKHALDRFLIRYRYTKILAVAFGCLSNYQ